MPLALWMSIAAFLAIGFPSFSAAQMSNGANAEMRCCSRASVDSTYAIRLQLDRLAEAIRHGVLDNRQAGDVTLENAVRTVAAAAAGRGNRPTRAGLGVLWDFGFDSVAIANLAEERVRVRAQARFTSDTTKGAVVTLVFRRRPDRGWALANHEGLTALLAAHATRLRRGEAR